MSKLNFVQQCFEIPNVRIDGNTAEVRRRQILLVIGN